VTGSDDETAFNNIRDDRHTVRIRKHCLRYLMARRAHGFTKNFSGGLNRTFFDELP
jgi:hypothetical protein